MRQEAIKIELLKLLLGKMNRCDNHLLMQEALHSIEGSRCDIIGEVFALVEEGILIPIEKNRSYYIESDVDTIRKRIVEAGHQGDDPEIVNKNPISSEEIRDIVFSLPSGSSLPKKEDNGSDGGTRNKSHDQEDWEDDDDFEAELAELSETIFGADAWSKKKDKKESDTSKKNKNAERYRSLEERRKELLKRLNEIAREDDEENDEEDDEDEDDEDEMDEIEDQTDFEEIDESDDDVEDDDVEFETEERQTPKINIKYERLSELLDLFKKAFYCFSQDGKTYLSLRYALKGNETMLQLEFIERDGTEGLSDGGKIYRFLEQTIGERKAKKRIRAVLPHYFPIELDGENLFLPIKKKNSLFELCTLLECVRCLVKKF